MLFSLHNTKLMPYQLRFLAQSLDKGCHHLTEMSFLHCAVGDAGIRCFLETCGRESFGTLTVLDLTNNNILLKLTMFVELWQTPNEDH